MNLCFWLFLLSYLQYNEAYDLQIQAAMKFMPKFLRGLQTGASYLTKIVQMQMEAEAKKRLQKEGSINKISESNTHDIVFRSEQQKGKGEDLINEMSKRAHEYLKQFAENMRRQLDVDENVSPSLDDCLRDFNTNVDAYRTYLQEIEDPDVKFEQEMILLDIVDTINNLLRTQQKRLFVDYTRSLREKIPDGDLQLITISMPKDIIDLKRQDFLYLCKMQHVCKIYPAFTDYLAELLSEFLKLSDGHYKVLIKTLISLLKKQQIPPLVMNNDLYENISKSMDLIIDVDENTRDWISLLRSIIIQRHKCILGGIDKDLKLRTQAIRILMDIIDKVFHLEGEDTVANVFETVTDALKLWANGNRKDIETILSKWLHFCDKQMNIAWSIFDIKAEVKALIEAIQNGETENNKEILKRLFEKGTVFIRNESLENESKKTSDIDSIKNAIVSSKLHNDLIARRVKSP